MKKAISFILVIMMIATMFSSCGNDNNKLVGNYQLTEGDTDIEYLSLYSDGTCMVNNVESGTWEVIDGSIKILGSYGGQFFSYDNIVGSYDADGDTLTIFNAYVDGDYEDENIVFTAIDLLEK